MDCYVVRIYRRDPAHPRRVAGIVEAVDRDQRQQPFASLAQLEAILLSARRSRRRAATKPARKRRP